MGGARLCASGHVAYGTRGREGRNGWMGCDAAGVTRVIARTKRPVDRAVGGGRRVGVGGGGGGTAGFGFACCRVTVIIIRSFKQFKLNLKFKFSKLGCSPECPVQPECASVPKVTVLHCVVHGDTMILHKPQSGCH